MNSKPTFIRTVRQTHASHAREYDITGFETLTNDELLKVVYPYLPFGGTVQSRNNATKRAVLVEYTD